MASIANRVKKAIVKEFNDLRKGGELLTAETLNVKDNFINDLGMDSFDKTRLSLALDDEFKDVFPYDIPDGDEEKWQTVGDVIRYVEEYLKKAKAS